MFDDAESGTWLLGPLAIDAVVIILTVLTLPMVYSIAIERRKVDREVWLDSLTLVGRSTLQAIGSITLVGIVGVTVFSLAPILLPILAGPTAILFCTVFNESMGRRRG